MGRGSHEVLIDRVCDLIVILDSRRKKLNRREIAERWDCSTRNVSYVIAYARRVYGVHVKSVLDTNFQASYELRTTGVFDKQALMKHRRKRQA